MGWEEEKYGPRSRFRCSGNVNLVPHTVSSRFWLDMISLRVEVWAKFLGGQVRLGGFGILPRVSAEPQTGSDPSSSHPRITPTVHLHLHPPPLTSGQDAPYLKHHPVHLRSPPCPGSLGPLPPPSAMCSIPESPVLWHWSALFSLRSTSSCFRCFRLQQFTSANLPASIHKT